MDMNRAVSVCALLAATGGMARAGLVSVTQLRSVSAVAENDNTNMVDGPETVIAEPFADFNALVSAGLTGGGAALGTAVLQISSFQSDRIVAQGSSSTSVSGSGDLFTRGDAVFELVFGVDRETEVEVQASIFGGARFAFEIDGGEGLLVGDGSLATTLIPGVLYRVTATATSQRSSMGTADADFFIEITGVPAPGSAAAVGVAGLITTRRRR